MNEQNIVYPYIPNSVPAVKKEMLETIGVSSVEALFEDIPQHLRIKGKMDLPEPIHDEYSLMRHVKNLLSKNSNTSENLNFLGAGCYEHAVPAVCDEINGRAEFLTAYAGQTYSDHGKFQAMFEFNSLMTELLDMDFLALPQYDGPAAAASALRMAARLTGRREVLLPRSINPETLSLIKNYVHSVTDPINVVLVNIDGESGTLDMEDLKSKVSDNTAAIYIENPGYLGTFEPKAEEIGNIAKDKGAEYVVYCDPISLGIVAPPSHYGATIACGDLQALGMHMTCGGAQAGFIAGGDAERAAQLKDVMIGIADTQKQGEYGFAMAGVFNTSYFAREDCDEYTGSGTALWCITAGVYLALMGPKGMEEVGQSIVQKARYAADRISELEGVTVTFNSPFFKEFVVNFDGTGKSVEDINQALLGQNIFGGKDLSAELPELGQSALYCVTETKTQQDIDVLIDALKAVTQ
ncbi:aminomethyl-transferring glycine dehydrogenase subunit GcvPA [Pseudomaricurvus alkylphenolicus]|uniref:aminomethyl-transferring glycine dehydrogenase subunit GcvPA n=1 Tax=Pseudomaricurvus alkylphenolicus TaxID=1306991 RepID=UPI0014239247|nr:aminomethyl-transferring glycine dehydrogenase subunit GcvPA [Pseudomaricurvus alkylphenolicus]NIB38547.1 aminomethyl-transferring glycine dehydrogenase subunit GcvPA [Pseudomaricurvus alkylphenolicus]